MTPPSATAIILFVVAIAVLYTRRSHEHDPLVLSAIDSALAGARGER